MITGMIAEHEHSTNGELCLAFANTISARQTATPNERLNSYADLLAWAEANGSLSPALAAHLAAIGESRPQASAEVLQNARSLREAIYRIFTAHADGSIAAAGDLETLNAALAKGMPHRRLVASSDGFAWQWVEEPEDLAQMLWPVAHSAAELLTSPDLSRVRECAGDTCNWLFVDRSKNRSRRWCDMQECGNVAKVRRYRSRQQTSG